MKAYLTGSERGQDEEGVFDVYIKATHTCTAVGVNWDTTFRVQL